MDSAGKKVKESKREPAHGPPLQARVAAANGTVCTTCGDDDPGAHGMNRGQSKMNGGKNVDEGSGHGMAKASKQSRRTRPLQADTAGGQSAGHRP